MTSLDDPGSLALRAEIAETAGSLPEAIGLLSTLARRVPTTPNLLWLASITAPGRTITAVPFVTQCG